MFQVDKQCDVYRLNAWFFVMQTCGVSKVRSESGIVDELSSLSEICIGTSGSLVGIFNYHCDAKLP